MISREVDVISRKTDVISRTNDVISRKTDVISREIDLISKKIEVISREIDVVWRKTDVISRKIDMISREIDVISREINTILRGMRRACGRELVDKAYQLQLYRQELSVVVVFVAGLEFAYRYAPKHMQGFVMGLFYLVQSAGSWVGIGLFFAWLEIDPDTSNIRQKDIKLVNYFFILAGVMFVTWLIFVIVSRRVALPLHYRKKVTFIVGQKPKEGDRRETLRQAPLGSEFQSDVL